jgi:hypothetical protein
MYLLKVYTHACNNLNEKELIIKQELGKIINLSRHLNPALHSV